MTIRERLEIENKKRFNEIVLFNDGTLFMKSLNESAELFIKYVKEFRLTHKQLKDGLEVDYIGVPAKSLDYYAAQANCKVSKTDFGCVFSLPIDKVEPDCLLSELVSHTDKDKIKDLITEIAYLDITEMTSIQALNYLNDLRLKARKIIKP